MFFYQLNFFFKLWLSLLSLFVQFSQNGRDITDSCHLPLLHIYIDFTCLHPPLHAYPFLFGDGRLHSSPCSNGWQRAMETYRGLSQWCAVWRQGHHSSISQIKEAWGRSGTDNYALPLMGWITLAGLIHGSTNYIHASISWFWHSPQHTTAHPNYCWLKTSCNVAACSHTLLALLPQLYNSLQIVSETVLHNLHLASPRGLSIICFHLN